MPLDRVRKSDDAGLRRYRVSPVTSTRVAVYHAEQAMLDASDGPWACVCEDHGTILNVRTLRIALATYVDPREWCDACRDAEGDVFVANLFSSHVH